MTIGIKLLSVVSVCNREINKVRKDEVEKEADATPGKHFAF